MIDISEVILESITKTYDNGVKIFEDISLKFPENELIAILGPSGCGKSTLLRIIAGLEEIDQGKIYIAGEDVTQKSPKERDISMVFQNYALYPHKTIYEIMEFGLKMRKVPKSIRKQRINDAVKVLDLEDLLERKPTQLSGGQRQRVALGRALVRDPKLFLLDEPLSNLDARLRVKMRSEIVQLFRNVRKTMIYVTHDQVEAMTMGTKVLLLNKGEIQQYDTPNMLYNSPENLFVAKFIGNPPMNIYALPIRDKKVVFCNKEICIPYNYSEKMIYLGIRPESIILTEGSAYQVSFVENLGNEQLVYLNINLEASLCVRNHSNDNILMGDTYSIEYIPEALYWFDINTEERLR